MTIGRAAVFAVLTGLVGCHHQSSSTATSTGVPTPVTAVTDSNPVKRVADSSLSTRPRGRFQVDTTLTADQRFLQLMVVRLGEVIDLVHDVEHRMQTGAVHQAMQPLDAKWGEEQLTDYALLHSLFGTDTIPHATERVKRMSDSLSSLPGYPDPRVVYRALAQHNRRTVAIMDRLVPNLTDPTVKRVAEEVRLERIREAEAFEKESNQAPPD
jgi:hypothetical protein